jgi:hypothetical protein
MSRIASSLIILLPLCAYAQSTSPTPINDRLGVLFTRDASIGLRLTSNGWAVFGNLGRNINQKRSSFYQLEFAEIKHSKERKQTSENFGGVEYPPKPYVFGKQNAFLALHLGIGRKILLGEKAEKAGVQVSFNYLVGPSLGLLKPYYLDLIYTGGTQQKMVQQHKYDPNDPEAAGKFLDFTQIYGSSGFSKGLAETRPIPGIHVKAGFNFDWASWGEFIKAIEVGATADIYYKRIPIMVPDLYEQNPNRAYFVGLYVAGQLGKKW